MGAMKIQPMRGIVARKQTYAQKETGIQKFLLEVAVLGGTYPVFYETESEWLVAPSEDTEIVVEGGLSPTRDGGLRLNPVVTVAEKWKPRQDGKGVA